MIDLHGVQLFFSEDKCTQLFWSVIKSRQFNKEWHCWWPWVTVEGHFRYYKPLHHCIPIIQHAQCTTMGYPMWAIISTVVFNRKDCYMMLSTTC